MATMRPTPVFLLRYWSAEEPINVGTGEDIGIAELTDTIARVVGFRAASRSTCQSPTARPGKRSTLPGCSRSGGARRSVSIRESARPIDAFARRAEPVARSSEPDRQKTRAMEQYLASERLMDILQGFIEAAAYTVEAVGVDLRQPCSNAGGRMRIAFRIEV